MERGAGAYRLIGRLCLNFAKRGPGDEENFRIRCSWSESLASELPPKTDIQIMIPGRAPADVRFAPVSGPNSTLRWMSAYDPKRTLVALAAY